MILHRIAGLSFPDPRLEAVDSSGKPAGCRVGRTIDRHQARASILDIVGVMAAGASLAAGPDPQLRRYGESLRPALAADLGLKPYRYWPSMRCQPGQPERAGLGAPVGTWSAVAEQVGSGVDPAGLDDDEDRNAWWISWKTCRVWWCCWRIRNAAASTPAALRSQGSRCGRSACSAGVANCGRQPKASMDNWRPSPTQFQSAQRRHRTHRAGLASGALHSRRAPGRG